MARRKPSKGRDWVFASMRIPGSSRKHRVVIPNTGQTLAQAQKQGALEAQRMEAAAIAASSSRACTGGSARDHPGRRGARANP